MELKPCPFCGGQAVRSKTPFDGPEEHYIFCLGCSCQTQSRGSFEMVLEAWNRRAPDLRAIDDILEGLSECIAQDLTEGNTHYLPGLQFAAGLVRSVRVRLTGNGA